MSLKGLAKQVLEILEHGYYDADHGRVSIAKTQQNAVDGSCLYTPDKLLELRNVLSAGNAVPLVTVSEGTTQLVARALAEDGRLVLLNFASARNPGGGFIGGAKAQEEDLCRCSGLYKTLVPHTDYYESNRQQKCMLYTDHAIYSPDVPFFKIRGTGNLLPDPFLASVITMPAPNTGPYLKRAGSSLAKLEACFAQRWLNVLAIARDQGHDTVLLGAWGCGAFRGDPVMASRTAKAAIRQMGADFKRIDFAIPGGGRISRQNLKSFRQQFAESSLNKT